MKVPSKEIMVYGVIAIVVLVAVWLYASTYLHPASSSLGVSVALQQLNASPQYFPDQSSYFAIHINNTGKSPISNLTLVMYLDNVQLHTYSITLPVGTSGEINTSYTYPSNGIYTFTVVADPASLLNIQNRAAAQSIVIVNVSAPQAPDVYTSIPNNGTISTQSFTLFQAGINAALFMADHYNIPYFNDMLGGGTQPLLSVFEDLSPYISGMNGALSVYSNSSYAYTAWLQGAATPPVIDEVVSSFRYPQTTVEYAGQRLTYYRVSNQTSICVFYYDGWTKIIEYGNASSPTTCYTLVPINFTPTEGNALATQLRQNPNLVRYQANFSYTNSSRIGSSIAYVNGNVSALNVFNTSIGFFGGLITSHRPPLDLSSINSTCLGVAYTSNNLNMCSTYIVSNSGGFGVSYALLNSSELTPNYTATLYSLVNNTLVLSAHSHAVSLLAYLNMSGTSLMWNSPYKNTCQFANTSIGCSIVNYSFANQSLELNLTNRLASPITVNKIGCYLGTPSLNISENVTIAPDSTRQINSICSEYTLPGGFSFESTFDLLLNYTSGGALRYTAGVLNVTSYSS